MLLLGERITHYIGYTDCNRLSSGSCPPKVDTKPFRVIRSVCTVAGMSDPYFDDLSPENLDELTSKVWGESSWGGKSCMSYLWPYTAGHAMFEVRRAITNYTGGGLHSTYDPGEFHISLTDGPPELSDLLVFVKAADSIARAAGDVLKEVVAEARANGATWQQIGEALGTNRKAAHKRFQDGLPERRLNELLDERIMSDTLVAFWVGGISEEDLGFDTDHWDAVPPEVAVCHAIRSYMHSVNLLALYLNPNFPMPPGGVTAESDWEKRDSKLERSYDVLRKAYHTLITPEALDVIEKYALKLPERPPWVDTNVKAYFTQAISCTGFAFNHFTKAWAALTAGDDRKFSQEILYVEHRMRSAVAAFARPECAMVVHLLERYAVDSGNSVIRYNYPFVRDLDFAELNRAWWKKDNKKIAELLGVDKIEDFRSLDEPLHLIDAPDDVT